MKTKFYETYSMTLGAFNQLLEKFRPNIESHLSMSSVSSSRNALKNIPELFLHLFFRYINVGSHVDIRLVVQNSQAFFHKCVNVCMQAIYNRESIDLATNFDVDPLTVLRGQRQCTALSSHRIICNCIGGIDGIFIRIKCPSGVPNPRACY